MTFNREIALSADSMDAYVSLFGMNDQNIALIEQECGVIAALRGNRLIIQGEEKQLDLAEQVIRTLFAMILRNEYVDRIRIRYVIAMVREGKGDQVEESLKSVIAVTHRGKQITCKGIDIDRVRGCTDSDFLVQESLIYAIISVVEAYVEVRRHFCRPSLHVPVIRGGKRHQFGFFFQPAVITAVILLLKVLTIEDF